MSLKHSRATTKVLLLGSAAAAALLLGTIGSSQAGFQWIPEDQKAPPPPVEAQAVPAEDSMSIGQPAKAPAAPPAYIAEQAAATQEPVQPVLPKVIMPADAPESARAQTSNVEILQSAAPDMPAAQPVTSPAAPLETMTPEMPAQPVSVAPDMPAAQTAPEATPAQAATPAPETVQGFGSDVPLALALQQVVPAQYAFSFDAAVNPGYRVSWTGGSDWKSVVDVMIAPLKLKASVIGNVVRIDPASGPTPHSAQPAAEEATQAPQSIQSESAQNQAQRPDPQRQVITDPGERSMAREMVAISDSLTPAPQNNPARSEAEAVPVPDISLADAQDNAADAPQHNTLQAPMPLLAESASTEASAQNEVAPASGIATAGTQQPMWEASQGSSLKTVLQGWSRSAGVELDWQASHDYRVGSDVFVAGSFQNAVKTIFTQGLQNAPQPQISFVGNTGSTGGAKLVVEDPA